MELDQFALNLFAHAVSQVTHRWFSAVELPSLSEARLQEGQAIVQELVRWDVSDWGDWIRRAAEDSAEPLAWMQSLLSRHQDLYERAAWHLHEHLRAALRADASCIAWCDARYPPLLRAIPDPPLALTVMGDLMRLGRDGIACVGSRKADVVALRESFKLGQLLAKASIQSVSGGAFGCDIAVHRGALATRACPLLASIVFAGGLSELYPKQNQPWFEQLRRRGALFISERLWWAPSRPLDFPIRNRIVSGMSHGTVVLQAAERSGALVTARLALAQGRDVWVLDQGEDDVRTAGGRALILDGARFFSSAEHLLDLLERTPAF